MFHNNYLIQHAFETFILTQFSRIHIELRRKYRSYHVTIDPIPVPVWVSTLLIFGLSPPPLMFYLCLCGFPLVLWPPSKV